METATAQKTEGLMFFYVEKKLSLIDITENQISNPITKEALMTIKKIEIDLKNKLSHWGITIETKDGKELKDAFSIVFFTKNMIDSQIWPGHRIEFKDFNKESFMKKMEEFVEKYDISMKTFAK